MKKLISVLMAAALLVSVSGCSKNNSSSVSKSTNSSPAASVPAADKAKGAFDDLSFTWYKNYDWYAAEKWAEEGESEIWLKNKFNINITYLDAGGSAATKLSTMMIDNKYPDAISIDRDQNLQALIDAGALVPLDDFIEGSYLQKELGNELIDMFRASDGHLYSFPNWAAPVGMAGGNQGWLIQTKWHKKLGSPEIKTYDDLYDYLTKVKKDYPEITPLQIGTSLAGIAPIYAGFSEDVNPGYMMSNVYRDNDKLQGILSDPVYQKTLLFINKLYREKLITQDMFTMTTDDYNQRMANGNYAIAVIDDVFSSDWSVPFLAQAAKDPELGTQVINPLVDNGVKMENIKTNWGNALGWNVAVITKDAADPKAIFAYFDYIFGPMGSLLTSYGAPGDSGYWQETLDSNEMPIMNDSYKTATTEEVDSKWMGSNWTANSGYMNRLTYYNYEKTGNATQIVKDQLAFCWNHSCDATELANIVPNADSDIGILYQNINNLYIQAIPEIINAPSEEACKAAIEKNIKALNDADLQKLLEWQTQRWAADMKILGKI